MAGTLVNGNVASPRRKFSVDEGTQTSFDPISPVNQTKVLGRQASISPSRRAHFSTLAVDLEGGQRHLPVRAASPVKSALKHSPSSSIRAESPAAVSVTGDEAAPTGKRRGSLRVSFDEGPKVAPLASGLPASRHAPKAADTAVSRAITYDDYDTSEAYKPMPALPKFGSVRRSREGDDTTGKSEETTDPMRQSYNSISTSLSTLVGEEPSKDFFVGGVLAQDFAAKQHGNEPLAPEVTSKDQLGDPSPASSTDSLVKGRHTESGLDGSAILASTKEKETRHAASHSLAPVPDIAILPPTPAAVEEKEETLALPGAFPRASMEINPLAAAAALQSGGASVESVPAQSEQVIAAPTSDTPQSILAPLTALPPVEGGDTDTEDNDSVYSDAAEDLSELEEDDIDVNFKSLDAIVDSPVRPPKPQNAAEWDEVTAHWRGLSEQRKQQLEEIQKTEKRASREMGTASSRYAVQPSKPLKKNSDNQPETQRTVAKTGTPKSALVPAGAGQGASAQPPLKSALKQSKPRHVEGTDIPTMRRTMRGAAPVQVQPVQVQRTQSIDEDEHVMPMTLRGGKPKPSARRTRDMSPEGEGSALAASRHAPPEARQILQKRAAPAPTSTAPMRIEQPLIRPTLQRSASSDSASSFKRKRKSKPAIGAGGSFSFRQSMRAPSEPSRSRTTSPTGNFNSSRFSVRSLSPAGSDRYSMRGSMRGNSLDAGSRSLRNKEPKQKSGGGFASKLSFGKRKGGSIAGSDVGSPPPSVNRRSRFEADSDDEEVVMYEDGRPPPASTRFQSRFADSDDSDDEPLPFVAATAATRQKHTSDLAPVRGIPRPIAEGNESSTDLEEEDSDHEKRATLRKQEPRSKIAIPPLPSQKDIEAARTVDSHAGTALAAGTMRKSARPSYDGDVLPSKQRQTNGLMSSKYAIRSQEQLASTIPQRPQQKRRLSSFLGLGSSKHKRDDSRNREITFLDTTPVPAPAAASAAPPPKPTQVEKVKREKLQRRWTPTFPTVDETKASNNNTAAPLTNGNLAAHDDNADEANNWPLPSPSTRPALGTRLSSDRPSTSDGYNLSVRKGGATGQRPTAAAQRRSLSEEFFATFGRVDHKPTGPASVAGGGVGEKHVGFDASTVGGEERETGAHYGRTGKKKKFQGLRRVFGMRD